MAITVVAGLSEVARRMAAHGFEVEKLPGWEHRGAGTISPPVAGAVNHWTAGPRTGDAPSLRVVTFGREGLRNALCNTYSSRRPKLYIVAAGVAWHAGLGSWRGVAGNSRFLGHEAENSGAGEWTDEHLELVRVLDREQADVFDYPVANVCDHFEWAPGRKIDRRDVGGNRWRAALIGRGEIPDVGGTGGDREEQGMYRSKKGDSGPDVVLLQLRLVAAGQELDVDGDYGDITAKAVAAVTGLTGRLVGAKQEHRIELAVQRAVSQAEIRKALKDLTVGDHDHKATVTSTVRLQ